MWSVFVDAPVVLISQKVFGFIFIFCLRFKKKKKKSCFKAKVRVFQTQLLCSAAETQKSNRSRFSPGSEPNLDFQTKVQKWRQEKSPEFFFPFVEASVSVSLGAAAPHHFLSRLETRASKPSEEGSLAWNQFGEELFSGETSPGWSSEPGSLACWSSPARSLQQVRTRVRTLPWKPKGSRQGQVQLWRFGNQMHLKLGGMGQRHRTFHRVHRNRFTLKNRAKELSRVWRRPFGFPSFYHEVTFTATSKPQQKLWFIQLVFLTKKKKAAL